MQPKVSVIISNRNNADLLKKSLGNLDEIRNKYYQNLEVLVVDNRSHDDSVNMIEDRFPWVHVLKSENKGLAAANNLGAKHATGDYLIFLGADGYPRIDTIGKLVEYMQEHPEVGIASPRLSLQGGEPDKDASRSFPTPWNSFTKLTGLYKLFPKSNLFGSYFKRFDDIHNPYETDACVTGFMLIPSSLYAKIGGFDQDYFAYGEDLDICYRMKQAGYKVMYLPHLESGHLKTRLNEKKASLSDKLTMAHSSTKAMRLFLKKNYKKKYSSALLAFMTLGTFALQAHRVSGVFLKHLFSRK